MVQVRPATMEDIPALLAMASDGVAEAGWSVPVDPTALQGLFERLMVDASSCLLVADADGRIVGTIGAITVPLWWNPAYRVGHALWWFVPRPHRGPIGPRLLAEFRAWCGTIGASHWSASAPARNSGGAYRRAGMVPLEQIWWGAR